MTVVGSQIKAARTLLGWSQDELAGSSNVSTSSVKTFEYGRNLPSASIREAVQRALEDAGIEFSVGELRVRVKKADTR
jgi:transcriptional regulator with XRE-family HTH domain